MDGRIPADQYGSSQLPLVGLVQVLVGAAQSGQMWRRKLKSVETTKPDLNMEEES